MFMGLTGQSFLSLLAVGFIGGLLSGFIGSGGAFVMTPAMMSLGVPGAIAVASNMCHKFPKAMVGAHKRNKYGQVDLKLGAIIGVSATVGVELGIRVQKWILATWGSAGSDLYVSVVFVVILVLVGTYVFRDAWKLVKSGQEAETPKLALTMQKIKLPPMIHFKKANVTISLWVTMPIGLATGLLASTIAVGGFVGVPGMIYLIGVPALMATATELVIAFIMGFWGSIEWALSGLIDIRLVLIILASSLIGVQVGALGTTYVKDHVIKVVMGTVMLIVAVSRGAKVPVYLSNLEIISVSASTKEMLNLVSFWMLIIALAVAGTIIVGAMVKGMLAARTTAAENAVPESA
ncbi:MAG: sulfite exporter TauE/SafE family protein [Thermoleophilia bacterium]